MAATSKTFVDSSYKEKHCTHKRSLQYVDIKMVDYAPKQAMDLLTQCRRIRRDPNTYILLNQKKINGKLVVHFDPRASSIKPSEMLAEC